MVGGLWAELHEQAFRRLGGATTQRAIECEHGRRNRLRYRLYNRGGTVPFDRLGDHYWQA